MSFLDKARQAADQATQHARDVTDQARVRVNESSMQERLRHTVQGASQRARDAAAKTKRGLATMVDKIDPGLLADIVIKATALQERANASLRRKGSPYRISEITITATIPPQVGFSIGRVGELDEVLTGREVDSTELVSRQSELSGEAVISLDGTTISHEELAAAEEQLAEEESVVPA